MYHRVIIIIINIIMIKTYIIRTQVVSGINLVFKLYIAILKSFTQVLRVLSIIQHNVS